MASEVAHGHHEIEHGEEHATNQTYVRVAFILAVITLVEVFVWYLPSARSVLVPVLIVLSVAKFLAVIGYFMHLKYDKPLFRIMFLAGLVLSLSVFIAALVMFWTDRSYHPLVVS